MKQLTDYDISKNNVHTIGQYKILDYLKQNINIYEFKVYLIDRNTIKVVDKENQHLYFKYNQVTKEVSYQDELKQEFEMEI